MTTWEPNSGTPQERVEAKGALPDLVKRVGTDRQEGKTSASELLQFVQVSGRGGGFELTKDLSDYYEAATSPSRRVRAGTNSASALSAQAKTAGTPPS